MNRAAEVMGEVHRLHHAGGVCGCSTPPSDLAPVTDQEQDQHMAQIGRRELVRMRDAGLPVDLERAEDVDLSALGRAVQPARLTELLDQIVAERQRDYPSTGCSGCDLGNAIHWPCTSSASGETSSASGPAEADADDPDPDNGPERSTTVTSDILDHPLPKPSDPGQADLAARGQPTGLDRNAKKTPMEKILAQEPPDEEWTPS